MAGAAPRTSLLLYLALGVSLLLIVRGVFTRGQTVVASTSLTGALAQAAGAREVRILTPPEVKYPPGYELLPSDIGKLNGASAVVYGGYEKMARKLVDVSKGRRVHVVRVDAAASPDGFVAQARTLAGVFHTGKVEQEWEKGFLERTAALKSRLAPYSGRRAVVNADVEALAAWAGLTVVQVVTPGEISPKTVAEAAAKEPDIVLDSFHMPVAKRIAENGRCRYAALIVFPGAEKTATFGDVLEYDTAQVLKAFGE